MNRRAALTGLGLALFGASCRARSKSKATPTPSPSAAATSAVAAAAPTAPVVLGRIGGSIARGRSYFAELLVFSDGRVEAALSDPEGHALNEPANVSLELATRAGERLTLALRYSPRRERFQAPRAREVALASGAATLRLEHNERKDEIAVPRAVVLVGPERGGHMFGLDGLGVELVPEASGLVRAFVRDAQGAPVTDPKLTFVATLLSQSLEKHRVALSWDAASSSYRGNATSALRPGPIELAIASEHARIQQAGLSPEPRHGGRVLLVGFHAVEVMLRPDEVELFVYDAFGKPYPAGHLELVVAFDAAQPLLYRLRWDEKTFSYRAGLLGRDVGKLPISVSLTAGEHTDFGAGALR